jgi:hypothetical protein
LWLLLLLLPLPQGKENAKCPPSPLHPADTILPCRFLPTLLLGRVAVLLLLPQGMENTCSS